MRLGVTAERHFRNYALLEEQFEEQNAGLAEMVAARHNASRRRHDALKLAAVGVPIALLLCLAAGLALQL